MACCSRSFEIGRRKGEVAQRPPCAARYRTSRQVGLRSGGVERLTPLRVDLGDALRVRLQ